MDDVQRQAMDVDIACVGFGPATAAFLTTVSRELLNEDGTPKLLSQKMPGMPLQIMCYERADDISFGVSGVVTKAKAIRQSFPDLTVEDISMAQEIKKEKMVYLLDPVGASRRSTVHNFLDSLLKPVAKNHAIESPFIPGGMNKHGGLLFSIGQFNQWVGAQIMSSGLVQLWPGTPVNAPLFDGDKVTGIRLSDQGVDLRGNPEAAFMPGMDIHADLTVVGDGPVGYIGQQLDEHFGLPEDHEQKDWAVGMKMVVELPEQSTLEAGTVLHTLGFPEPEIFGFLYVHPDRLASLGIFIPSWFDNPARTSYRYLQHWMMHPYLWKDLQGGTLKSWGAKSLQESGKHGEPLLAGDGFARIGEGSGSTNIFLNSGVDEAWMTGILLGKAVITLATEQKPFSKDNLQATYVKKRHDSWLEREAQIAAGARNGFQRGFFTGLLGMGLTMLSGGIFKVKTPAKAAYERSVNLIDFYKGRIPEAEIKKIQQESYAKGIAASDALMTRAGWPDIPYDGQLLMTHQDALFSGGKVQAAAGYKDHVVFLFPYLCETCENKLCIEICSGQAITPGENGIPEFDREKCIHCGACMWNCVKTIPGDPTKTNISFQAGSGGLHSVEN
ncbi:4Fe-4S ferredoxin [candidate division KSB1 bacterium]|nr:4Fe-4S ferredoxin [candidate division KSB1 bacterium]RQW01485.1 MAG: 4Fe-4S ferredoxin [candidate division KSB1 bacterium]